MTIRKWMYLFISTLIVGGAAALVTGFAIGFKEYTGLIASGEILQLLSVIVWMIGLGLMFSVLSQMGFFAYLTVHRFGLGLFRSVSLWNAVQLVLTAFVLFDLIYLRYTAFASEGASLGPYVVPALLLLAYGLVIAYVKMKQTNRGAFVPALFFMTVVTIIEWFPALRQNDQDWMYLMLFPLLASNTWQLLLLHRLNVK
ncbi:KinB-signaling pathway activation protein [Bacillus marinisedimentorum]|uniref:KinB-signaling pathway activation protein n=1 Tax=Bacillus marinisedimentorum TaxID=1821260 RepID=UPI000A75B4C2|nr:KinB-signaling pathway activation protein [Bacillus marinisedimentorum]